jgi:ABC-2 type transport system ATP-binding protein
MEPIIVTQGLTREFGRTVAVSDLDLQIQSGEIFGLVGPDGAGKTTSLRLLAGLLNPTSGTVTVDGFDTRNQAEALKPKIGYMAQQFSLYADLTVRENLALFGDLFNVTGKTMQERSQRLLKFANLTDFQDRRAQHLSGGMQKKLALSCALINLPEILLLDEPTTGVDPVSRREFWDILVELHLDGTTIVVSTPYMDEAERCQRVGLMYEGRMIVCANPKRIQEMVEGDLIQFKPDRWQEALEIVSLLPGVLEVQTYGDLLHVFVDSAEQRQPLLENRLKEVGISVSGIRQAQPRMEEAFISLLRKMER